MNIDRTSASMPLRGPQVAPKRVDMTVSDAGISQTKVSGHLQAQPSRGVVEAAAPAPAPAPAQITSSRALQNVLSSAETRALRDAFGDLASREPAAPRAAGAGLYAFNGNRSPNPAVSRLGGMLDISG